jgi:hypothetical protein
LSMKSVYQQQRQWISTTEKSAAKTLACKKIRRT